MNMVASAQLIRNTTAKITIGLSISSFKDASYVIKRYPKHVLAMQIANLPRNLIIPPIPFVIKNVPAFFRARINAFIAEGQKFWLVKAI